MSRSLAFAVLATLAGALSTALAPGLLAGGRVPSVTPQIEQPWTGRWSRPPAEVGGYQGGVTSLVQRGSTVTGSFNWGGGGPIRGTVSGATLSGEWEMTSTKGTFRLTLAPDARSFTGTWQGTKGSLKGQSGSWTGSYLGGGTPRSSKVTETYAWSVKGRGSASPPVVSVFGRGRLTVDAKGRIRTASGRLDVTFVRAAGTHDLWRLKTAVPGGFSRKEHAGEVSLVLWLRAEVVDAVGPARIRCAADPVGNVQVFLKAKDSTDVILELRRLCGVPYVGLDGKDRSATLRASIRKVG